MDNILPILIGALLACIGSVLGWIVINRNSLHSQAILLNKIEQAENELSQDLERIGTDNLQKTEAGRELLNLLGLSEFVLGADSSNSELLLSREEIIAEAMPRLTARQREILRELKTGATNQQIAARLVISEQTVKNHVSRLLKKLKIKSRHELS